MKSFNALIKEKLAKKNVGQLSRAAFIVQLAKHYAKYPAELSGYIRWHTLFVRLSGKEDKTKWFLEKENILKAINEQLATMGYEYVLQDIRIK